MDRICWLSSQACSALRRWGAILPLVMATTACDMTIRVVFPEEGLMPELPAIVFPDSDTETPSSPAGAEPSAPAALSIEVQLSNAELLAEAEPAAAEPSTDEDPSAAEPSADGESGNTETAEPSMMDTPGDLFGILPGSHDAPAPSVLEESGHGDAFGGAAAETAEDTPLSAEGFEEEGIEAHALQPFAPGAPIFLPEVDSCEEPTYSGAVWTRYQTEHFSFYTLAGTAAERDIQAIASVRETAYAALRERLGIQAEPHITVYLSPSRLAAEEHGRAFGVAWPGWDEYHVIYTGDEDAYESTHYGHELAHVLSYYADPSGRAQVPFLAEGLAELLDHSERDYHTAYAERLNAGLETRVYLTGFEDDDARGQNRGRAGSFVAYVEATFGMPGVLELIRATSVDWRSGCYRHRVVGCISDATALGRLLEHGVDEALGASWEAVRAGWEQVVRAALDETTSEIEGPERAEIQHLLAVADWAINTSDAAAFRSTMEGFYCEWGGEALRGEIAARAVSAQHGVRTELVALYAVGTQNYPSAVAVATRTDHRGVSSAHMVELERISGTWRIAWSPDWH
jgi:hypothetical protein